MTLLYVDTYIRSASGTCCNCGMEKVREGVSLLVADGAGSQKLWEATQPLDEFPNVDLSTSTKVSPILSRFYVIQNRRLDSH